ncbi:MAG: alpha/beta hydrolase family protein [Thiotrichales bacterium]
MKKQRFVLVLFALLTHPVGSAKGCEETEVNLENGVKGTLCRPKIKAREPVVLMLHGFGSNRDEVGNLYQRLAEALDARGIGSLRIDFRGWGASEGKMTESTVTTQLADANAAYSYLSALPWVDQPRMGTIGFSLGGGIATLAAAEHPQRYATMVTWSSVGNFRQDFLNALGQKNFDRAAKKGSVSIDLGWREVTLGQGFFNSLNRYDLKTEIKKYPGNYLAIAGSKDFSSAYTEEFVQRATGLKKKAVIIQGADHIFGVLGDDQSAANQVLRLTAEWFEQSLVSQLPDKTPNPS